MTRRKRERIIRVSPWSEEAITYKVVAPPPVEPEVIIYKVVAAPPVEPEVTEVVVKLVTQEELDERWRNRLKRKP